jgi:hypothetical protein
MLPDAFDRLLSALRGGGQRRITLEQLRTEFARACPELAEQADRRDHLSRLIQAAAARGALNLPRNAAAWDRAGAAALPRFIVLNVPRVRRPAPIPGYAWHPVLAFAAHEANARRLATLRTVNEWLKTDPDLTYTVPIKERSLEIFGDEKRLDQLRTSNTHFFSGQLALPALGCRICPIPLPCENGPPEARGGPILIVENNDTWASFCAWNRAAKKFAAVAYAGGGNAKGISYDELFIDSLLERCGSSELFYFGDLDRRGLRIGAGAAQRRAERNAVPLMPAATFYRWLLAHGARVAVEVEEPVPAEDLAWLPGDLHAPVVKLFAAPRRIPQECLGTRVLRQWDVARDGAIPG